MTESHTDPAPEDVASPAPGEPPVSEARTPVSSGVQMKRRNPAAVWPFLPLITLGIYTYVWYYKIHREMAEHDRRREIPVVGPVLVLLLLGWTLIAPLISFYNTGQRVRDAQVAAGLNPSCSPTLAAVLYFALGANALYLQIELNKVIDANPDVPQGGEVPLFV